MRACYARYADVEAIFPITCILVVIL